MLRARVYYYGEFRIHLAHGAAQMEIRTAGSEQAVSSSAVADVVCTRNAAVRRRPRNVARISRDTSLSGLGVDVGWLIIHRPEIHSSGSMEMEVMGP